MAPSIDVVVVSYRATELLRECLRALEGQDSSVAALNVIVVDNDSGDGTAQTVEHEFPNVVLIRNRENRGFSAASNQGIEAGKAPLVLVLNPDASIDEGTLPPLLAALDGDERIGAIGPQLVRPDGSLDHAAKRSFPTPVGAIGHFLGLSRLAPRSRRFAQYVAPEVERGQVDAINGAFMLLRRAALDEVGLFDQAYWMYMEDLDLCHRLADAGWKVVYEPDAVARHLKGGSAGELRSLRLNAHFHYGMYRFDRKFNAPGRNAAANLAVHAGIATKFAASALRTALRRAGRSRDT